MPVLTAATTGSSGPCTLMLGGALSETDPCSFAVSAEGVETIFRLDYARTDGSPGASDAYSEVRLLTPAVVKTFSAGALKATGTVDTVNGASTDSYSYSVNYGTTEGSLDQFTLTSVSADSPPAVHGRLKATLAEQNAGPGTVTLDVAF